MISFCHPKARRQGPWCKQIDFCKQVLGLLAKGCMSSEAVFTGDVNFLALSKNQESVNQVKRRSQQRFLLQNLVMDKCTRRPPWASASVKFASCEDTLTSSR